MRFSQYFCGLLFGLASAAPALAQSILPYQFSLDGGRQDRYLGDESVGRIQNAGVRFYADTPDRKRVLALEYSNYENHVPAAHGLELAEESYDIGLLAPLAPVAPKLALSINRYAQGDDYWALGFYPQIPLGQARIDLALERDADDTKHLGGTIQNDWKTWFLISGYSREQANGHGGPIEEDRYGALMVKRHARFALRSVLGSAVNQQTAPTWIVGLYRPANHESSDINPAGLLLARRKPEADYLLGLVSLWGRALGEDVCSDISRSFLTGALSRSRVVRNRDFNTPGVSRGYDAMDFGRVVAAFTLVDVQAGLGAHLRESQVGLYGTLPRSYGPLHNPFLGLEYTTSTDLTYNPVIRNLDDWGQAWTTVLGGFKLHINQKADPHSRKRPGYLRLSLSARFAHSFDGVFATATIWQ